MRFFFDTITYFLIYFPSDPALMSFVGRIRFSKHDADALHGKDLWRWYFSNAAPMLDKIYEDVDTVQLP